MRAMKFFWTVSLLWTCAFFASAGEIVLNASSNAEKIERLMHDVILKNRQDAISLKIGGVGEFSYHPPLADNNVRNPWHAFAHLTSDTNRNDTRLSALG